MSGKKSTDNKPTSATDSIAKTTESGKPTDNGEPKEPLPVTASASTKKASGSAAPQSKQSTSSSTSTGTTTPKKPKAPTTYKAHPYLGWLLFFVFIFVLVTGAYLAWQFWQKQNTRIENTEQQLQQQHSKLTQLDQSQQQQVSQQQVTSTQLQQALNHQRQAIEQRLDAHAKQLTTLSGNNRDSWMLEEARYLLRLASQRQKIGGNASSIIGLMESADDLLQQLDAADVFAVRENIRKDILALKVAPIVDREGLYLQLSALYAHISHLPNVPLKSNLNAAEEAKKIEVEQDENEANETHWYDSIVEAFTYLERYVRIENHNQKQEPLLTVEAQQLMILRLQLSLEQAQLALLQQEQAVYQNSLEKMIGWLNLHYNHYPEKPALVNQLTELKNTAVASVLPGTSSSLSSLNDFILNYYSLKNNKPQNNNVEPKPLPETKSNVESNNNEGTAI